MRGRLWCVERCSNALSLCCCLERIHTLGAHAPFSGGQQQWDAFISWWANEEIEKVKRVGVLDHLQISESQEQFATLQPLLVQRPIVLLHGDLQAEHILVDPQTEQVLAFLDFADAQPGDPLLDIAVVTLWDHGLADFLLEGYSGIENSDRYLVSHSIEIKDVAMCLPDVYTLFYGVDSKLILQLITLQCYTSNKVGQTIQP